MRFVPYIALPAALFLGACQMTPSPASTGAKPAGQLAVLLQRVDNIRANPQPLVSNQASLFKLSSGCLVQFDARHATGEAHEFWTFRKGKLQSAYTLVQQFAPDTTLQPATNPPAVERREFNVADPQVQQNFQSLLGNFAAHQVAQCR